MIMCDSAVSHKTRPHSHLSLQFVSKMWYCAPILFYTLDSRLRSLTLLVVRTLCYEVEPNSSRMSYIILSWGLTQRKAQERLRCRWRRQLTESAVFYRYPRRPQWSTAAAGRGGRGESCRLPGLIIAELESSICCVRCRGHTVLSATHS